MQTVDFAEINLVQRTIEGPRHGALQIEGPRELALETKSRAKNAARLSDEGKGYLKFARCPQVCLADDGMNKEIFKELAEVKSGFLDFESRCEKLKKSHEKLKKSHEKLKKSHEKLKKSHEELRERNRALSKVLEGVSLLEVALSRLMC